ncbi:MAG TPA: ABC transporter permease [Chloroflexota bacterium]|jgi:peptide/nickel transport system permease protein
MTSTRPAPPRGDELAAAGLDVAPSAPTGPGRGRSALDRFRRNPRAIVGATIVVALCLMALLAPLLAPYPPEVQSLALRYRPPSPEHWMGTDSFGRDVLSRAIWAARVSLAVGVLAVAVSISISVVVGSLAGYYGGRLDNLLMRFTDMMLAFPTLFLLIAIVAAFGSQLPILIAVLGLTSWELGARVVRGEVLSLKTREFVQAARALGAGDARIIRRHILPNVLPIVIISATIRVPLTILLEAALSYLGLGVQPPIASWGNMVADGKAALRIAWWVTAFPGAFIFAAVMAFNLLGDGLRDALDPRMKT